MQKLLRDELKLRNVGFELALQFIANQGSIARKITCIDEQFLYALQKKINKIKN